MLMAWLGLEGLPNRDPGRFTRLCRSVADLSRLFTKGQDEPLPRYFNEAALRAGYVAYFLPVNFAKVQAVLDELPSGQLCQPENQPLKVLDLGSGPGTGGLAVLDWVRQRTPRSIEVVAVDQSRAILRELAVLWQAYGQVFGNESASLKLIEADLERAADHGPYRCEGPFDLIVMVNVLNELWRGRRNRLRARAVFVLKLLELLVPHGTLIMIEPALRNLSRELHRVRDLVLETGAGMIYSPCLHDRPCPALARPEDWCHEERPWTPPTIVASIDRAVGFSKDALKFSYVVFRRDGLTLMPRAPNCYRVVSALRSLKGEQRAWLCSEAGRHEVSRLDRFRSDSNALMDAWSRGTIVRISKIVRKEQEGKVSALWRIPADATVEIVRTG
jgi:ribosomal protein RSM22 (predicted rRNA methylase)